MTGQPADQNESQNDQQQAKWDAQTRALAACLEALLEQDRTQSPDVANGGSRDAGGRPRA